MKSLTRRDALSLLAVTAGTALLPRAAFAETASEAGTTLIQNADVCLITPEVTEGPYYFDPALVRGDITEGRPGLATTVRLQIVDEACKPLAGARVDIWHCDASGVYSGYSGQPGGNFEGETFMRGTQFADDDGIVEFATVYPGWYRGRTTHIHFKVFVDEATLLTGQLFFPDAVSDAVYATAPYSATGTRDMRNDSDGIARQAGERSIASVEELPEGYLVQLIVGVEPLGEFGGMSFPATT